MYYCTEDLIASLRDPEAIASGITRHIYLTAKPFGSEGATGQIQQGDFAADLTAKIIYFDTRTSTYIVLRNGNPPRPAEPIPEEDAGALLRSFVRDGSSFEPITVTITDALLGKNIETIRKVIPAEQIELHCQHRNGQPRDDEPSVVSGVAFLGAMCILGGIIFVYWKFFRRPSMPASLPTTHPYVIDSKRLYSGDEIAASDVRSVFRGLHGRQ